MSTGTYDTPVVHQFGRRLHDTCANCETSRHRCQPVAPKLAAERHRVSLPIPCRPTAHDDLQGVASETLSLLLRASETPDGATLRIAATLRCEISDFVAAVRRWSCGGGGGGDGGGGGGVALERGDFSLVGGASPVTSGSRSDNSPIELALNFGGVAHAWTCMSPTFPKRMISFPDRVDTRTRMSPGTCRSLYCMRAGPRVSRAHPAATIAG